MHRSSHPAFFFALALAIVASPVCGGVEDLPDLSLVQIANVSAPTSITHAGDVRLFITLKDGRILIHDGSALLPQPFLDIRGRVGASAGEQGLFSVAFHPSYPATPFFYVDYTDSDGDTVVSRFRVDPADPDRALPGSETALLSIDQPFSNHNGGQLAFGPDGYLYIGMGDGGSANDPSCNAQRDASFLGKLLRIDVDSSSAGRPYAIPPDNPFAGSGSPLDEIWAFGLRNPWRFSFDRTAGDLYLADVGQGSREEIDFQPAAAAGGRNYGWKVMEGTQCTGNLGGCPGGVPSCSAPALTPPIIEYTHQGGRCSVTGGFVYRGGAIPDLTGVYLYGDFCTGEIWAAERQGAAWQSRLLQIAVGNLSSFGEGADGELFLASLSGGIYRLVATGLPPTPSPTPTPMPTATPTPTPPPVPERGALQLAQASYQLAETAGLLSVQVERVGGDDGSVSTAYASESGSAAAGTDFTAVSGTLSWADGDATPKTFTVPIADDAEIEPAETFTVRLAQPTGGATLGTPASATVTLLDDDLPAGPCVEAPTVLCLLDRRFRVSATWEKANGDSGPGRAEPFSSDSGWFWFFNRRNAELVVKVRDACVPPFDRYWFFAAGLTNVDVAIIVADTRARQVRRYVSPLGTAFLPVQDTAAFATCD